MLNSVNNRTIRGAFGDPIEGWNGKIIVLFPTMAEFRGKMGPAMRVRIPPPKQATGNGQGQAAAKPAPAEPPPPPPATTSVADDLDDEIRVLKRNPAAGCAVRAARSAAFVRS